MSTVAPATPASPTTGPRPLQLLDSNLTSSPVLSPRSPLAPGLSTPPPSARSSKSARRQSSISYFPSDHVSFAETRSPRTPSRNSFPRRSHSMGVWGEESPGLVGRSKGDRRSLGAPTRNPDAPLSPGPSTDRGPLTLTEKHADLLHFIAQKESKCLELRSQLATHEAELAQLKRKWERIVSRGMDRAYNSPSPLSTSPSASSAAVVQPPSTVSSLIPTANAAIKEGVRLLAAGLELSATEPSSPPAFAPPVVPISGIASVSRAHLASSKKAAAKHAATQSMSSTSTSTSTTRSASSQSQRLSQSSASSVLSSLDEPLEEKDETISSHPATISEERPEVHADTVEVSPTRSTLRRRSKEGDKPSVSTAAQPEVSRKPSQTKSKPKAPLAITTPTSPLATSPTLPTPVSGWMGSVGRKWEELQKADTFTKSQKRASLLLSDMSQSLFAALASPTPQSGFQTGPSPLSTVPSSSSASLLDDDQLDTAHDKGLGAVLAPTIVKSPSTPSHAASKQDADLDEDWNW